MLEKKKKNQMKISNSHQYTALSCCLEYRDENILVFPFSPAKYQHLIHVNILFVKKKLALITKIFLRNVPI